MENLYIPATERSPAVDFDFESGVLSLRGESYPEDTSRVFAPMFAALNEFLPNAVGRAIRFEIELIYFNSSSAKALLNMFTLLDRAAAAGVEIVVDWRFAPDDETMKEFGEDFSEDLGHLSFNLVETGTAE